MVDTAGNGDRAHIGGPAVEASQQTQTEIKSMANGTWKRTTSATRRADRQIRYAHVSVQVGVSVSESTGMLIPTRTPKGEGSTATRAKPKPNQGRGPKRVGHDWPGKYPGQLASIEALRRDRRKDHRKDRQCIKDRQCMEP